MTKCPVERLRKRILMIKTVRKLTPAAIDENTGKENDPLEEIGDEPPSTESELVNGESDREKKKDLSLTKNRQQRVTRTKTRKTASQQKNEEETGEDKTWTRGPWTPTLDQVHGPLSWTGSMDPLSWIGSMDSFF